MADTQGRGSSELHFGAGVGSPALFPSGDRMWGTLRSSQSCPPQHMRTSSPEVVCKINQNSPSLSLLPSKSLLLSLMTPEQSPLGRSSYRENKAKKNKDLDVSLPQAGALWAHSPSTMATCACPALRGCRFGRQEATSAGSSCCCLQPGVWLQRHLGILRLGGQGCSQHGAAGSAPTSEPGLSYWLRIMETK